MLIDVDAEDLAVGLVFVGGGDDGLEDLSAAGEDGLDAAAVPAVAAGDDFVVRVEGSGIVVLDFDVDLQLVGGGEDAGEISPAVLDDGISLHAAFEGEVTIALLDGSVAEKEARLVFLVEDVVGVAGSLVGIGIIVVLLVGPRRREEGRRLRDACPGLRRWKPRRDSRADDDLGASADRLLDGSDSGGGGVFAGLEIGLFQIVLRGELLDTLVGELVEGAVVDVADVGDHGDVDAFIVGFAGRHTEDGDQRQSQTEDLLFHTFFPPFCMKTKLRMKKWALTDV